MEKAVKDTAVQDDTAGPETARAPGRDGGGDAATGGDASNASKTTAAPHDGGWEADYSLLAAMGIVIAPAKPGHKNDAHPGGAGGTAKAAPVATAPGIATPPKGQPQGKVTPEIKKELQAKKEAKANPKEAAAGGAGAGGAGAQPNAQAGDAAAKPAVAAAPGGAEAPGAAPPGDGAGKPGAHNDDDIDGHNVEKLVELLERDHDPEHRRAAVRALGKLRSVKARDALQKATRDKDPMIARAAEAALATAHK